MENIQGTRSIHSPGRCAPASSPEVLPKVDLTVPAPAWLEVGPSSRLCQPCSFWGSWTPRRRRSQTPKTKTKSPLSPSAHLLCAPCPPPATTETPRALEPSSQNESRPLRGVELGHRNFPSCQARALLDPSLCPAFLAHGANVGFPAWRDKSSCGQLSWPWKHLLPWPLLTANSLPQFDVKGGDPKYGLGGEKRSGPLNRTWRLPHLVSHSTLHISFPGKHGNRSFSLGLRPQGTLKWGAKRPAANLLARSFSPCAQESKIVSNTEGSAWRRGEAPGPVGMAGWREWKQQAVRLTPVGAGIPPHHAPCTAYILSLQNSISGEGKWGEFSVHCSLLPTLCSQLSGLSLATWFPCQALLLCLHSHHSALPGPGPLWPRGSSFSELSRLKPANQLPRHSLFPMPFGTEVNSVHIKEHQMRLGGCLCGSHWGRGERCLNGTVLVLSSTELTKERSGTGTASR